MKNLCISSCRIFKSSKNRLSRVEQRVLEIQSKLVKAFGLDFGNVHGEYIYDHSADKVYLNEIAARGGGCCTSTHIIPLVTGINTLKMLYHNYESVNEDKFEIKNRYCIVNNGGFWRPLHKLVEKN